MRGKHRGRFKWKKYSRYNGNLRGYWIDPNREGEHHKPTVRLMHHEVWEPVLPRVQSDQS